MNGTDNLPAWGRLGAVTKHITFSARLPKFESQLHPYDGTAELSLRHLRWGSDNLGIAAPQRVLWGQELNSSNFTSWSNICRLCLLNLWSPGLPLRILTSGFWAGAGLFALPSSYREGPFLHKPVSVWQCSGLVDFEMSIRHTVSSHSLSFPSLAFPICIMGR